MQFFDYTIDWCKGEIFEARIILIFGIIAVVCAIMFWKTGSTANAKAMFYPLLITGILFSGIGIAMLFKNNERMEEFARSYYDNKTTFVKAEKERTENFIGWYPITFKIAAALIIIGLALTLFWTSAHGRAIGLTLMLIGLVTVYVDHFSEERAAIYHQKIVEEINTN
jgi:putative Mn2+ efflux pump MntP